MQSGATWPANTGLTGHIMRTGMSIVTDDYLEECKRREIQPQTPGTMQYSHAWMGVALAHHDRVFGVMVASMYDAAVRYGEADVDVLATVAAQAATAVANAQLYRQIQQQAGQLALINRIGRTIAATLDPHEVPMLIMQQLQAALDVEDGAMLIEERAGGDLIVRYTLQPNQVSRLPHGAGVAGDALRHGAVRIANDMASDQRRYEPFDTRGPVETRSLICAPVTGRRQLRGVIQLRNKRGGPFTAADAQLLEAVAEQAAAALENDEN